MLIAYKPLIELSTQKISMVEQAHLSHV